MTPSATTTWLAAVSVLLFLRVDASDHRVLEAYLQEVSSYARGTAPAPTPQFVEQDWKGIAVELAALSRDLPNRSVAGRAPRVTPVILGAAAVYHIELGIVAEVADDSRSQKLQYGMSRQINVMARTAAAPPSIVLAACKALTFALQRGLYIEELEANLGNCLQWFPDDSGLLLARGSLFELMASPRLAGARELGLVGPRDVSLQLALKDFSGVQSDSLKIEAETRSIRVLGSLGRPNDAVDAAKKVLERPSITPDVRFIALMAEGDAYLVLDRLAEARAAYAEATTLRPSSQSPRLALATLLTLTNQHGEAADQVRRALAIAPEDDDPLWVYDFGQASQLPRAVAEARSLLRQYSAP